MDVDLTRRAFSRHNLANPLEVARDGQEAVDFISGWQDGDPLPAVILLDLKLPKLNGLEVLRVIRAHREFSVVPVVILTSSREEQDLVRTYELGVNAYVVKPVDFQQFSESVRALGFFWAVLNEAPPPTGRGPTP